MVLLGVVAFYNVDTSVHGRHRTGELCLECNNSGDISSQTDSADSQASPLLQSANPK